MATTKAKKIDHAKKSPAKKAMPRIDVAALAQHYSVTCCSIDFKALLIAEESYAEYVLED